MNNSPLVSVIIPTKNSAEFIEKCLSSVKEQTYKNTQVIVVDNNSSDNTKGIAQKYTKFVFNKGPERNVQRNFGAQKATGDFLLFIDSDMELGKDVIKECMEEASRSVGAVIIPEKSVGNGFWAQCKALEKSFYLGIDWIEAARFFSKAIFHEFKGYDNTLISGEDWDLNQRIKNKYKVVRIKSFVFHNEGHLSLIKDVSKKFYYSRTIRKYMNKNKKEFRSQSSIVKRYGLFFTRPGKLFANPILGLGMLFMKTCEFSAGAAAYLISR